MKRILAAASLLAALAFAFPASAQVPQSTDVTISTTVSPTCSFTIAAAFTLPNYDATAAVTAAHPFSIRCTPGETATVRLAGFTGQLTDGTNNLAYTLAKPGGAGNWTSAPADRDWSVATTGIVQSFDFSATVAAGQFVPAGAYSETITLTLDL